MRKICVIVAPGLVASILTGCATPLHRAAKKGDLPQIRRLLDAGANMEAKNYMQYFETPICNAVWEGKHEAVKLLCERGADVNCICQTSRPLCWALIKGDPKTAQVLIDCGAEMHNPCSHGKTPMALAREKGYGAIVRALEKKGVEVFESGGVSKQDIAGIVQAAVAGATAPQGTASQPKASLSSDVDAPSYKLTERPDDFAVVVGIGKYSDIPEAQYADRDGEAVKNHLLSLGFPSRNVVHLTGEKAGYKGIEKFVETWLPKNVAENSRVVFYFSGHGAPDAQNGQAYLLPYDGDPNFLENTGYPIKRLYEKLGALKAKDIIVAMDSCFSGAGGRSVLAKGARPLVTKVEASTVPGNLAVFAAASGDQITSTLEEQGHGTFTYYFLKGLGGEAKNASGQVTVKALYDYLKPKVQDAARRQNRDQEPVLHAQGDQELVRF